MAKRNKEVRDWLGNMGSYLSNRDISKIEKDMFKRRKTKGDWR